MFFIRRSNWKPRGNNNAYVYFPPKKINNQFFTASNTRKIIEIQTRTEDIMKEISTARKKCKKIRPSRKNSCLFEDLKKLSKFYSQKIRKLYYFIQQGIWRLCCLTTLYWYDAYFQFKKKTYFVVEKCSHYQILFFFYLKWSFQNRILQ